ncbi:MAG TPA: hypothetical protein VG895_05340 [Patescibacteria group bacterium]|nr:hypothetical protein [Patescibacteria group bacterium]
MSSGIERDYETGEITIINPDAMSFKEKGQQYFRAIKGGVLHNSFFLFQQARILIQLPSAPNGEIRQNNEIIARGKIVTLASTIVTDEDGNTYHKNMKGIYEKGSITVANTPGVIFFR